MTHVPNTTRVLNWISFAAYSIDEWIVQIKSKCYEIWVANFTQTNFEADTMKQETGILHEIDWKLKSQTMVRQNSVSGGFVLLRNRDLTFNGKKKKISQTAYYNLGYCSPLACNFMFRREMQKSFGRWAFKKKKHRHAFTQCHVPWCAIFICYVHAQTCVNMLRKIHIKYLLLIYFISISTLLGALDGQHLVGSVWK